MQSALNLKLVALALSVVAVIAAGCTATQTVTINESASVRQGPEVRPDSTDDETRERASDSEDAPGSVSAGGVPDEECRFVEVDDFGDIQIAVDVVASGLVEQSDITLYYRLIAGNGTEIAASDIVIVDVQPNERLRLTFDTVEAAPADPAGITCEVLELEPYDFAFDTTARPAADDVCGYLEIDRFGDIQIQVDVANPFAEGLELRIHYALRAPDGTRFGDGIIFTIELRPGLRFVDVEDSVTDLPVWLTESEVRCEILSIAGF